MKKTIVLIGIAMASIPAFAQGFLDFSWFAAGQPAGTGVRIGSSSSPASQQPGWYVGSDYSVEAYMATGASQAESSLAPIASTLTTFFGATSASSGPTVDGAGVFGAGLANSGLAVGPATIEVRAWYNGGGASSYAAALAAGVNTGVSSLYNINLVDSATPPNSLDSIAFQQFTVSTVPEPSTFALAGLGAAAMLIFRRRK